MSKDLKQRIEKLERQVGVAGFETKLRALVRRWGVNEEGYLRAASGYERQLGQALGEDGGITWEGFLLLRDLLHPSRPSSPTPRRKGAAAEPGLKSPQACSEPRKMKRICHFEKTAVAAEGTGLGCRLGDQTQTTAVTVKPGREENDDEFTRDGRENRTTQD